jgi:hypothetical protein
MSFRRARRFFARFCFRSQALSALAAFGLLCCPITCAAQMVGPTPQPQGVPVTPEQAEQVRPEHWAIHGQGTLTWLLQPAFRSHTRGRRASAPTRTAGKRSTLRSMPVSARGLEPKSGSIRRSTGVRAQRYLRGGGISQRRSLQNWEGGALFSGPARISPPDVKLRR